MKYNVGDCVFVGEDHCVQPIYQNRVGTVIRVEHDMSDIEFSDKETQLVKNEYLFDIKEKEVYNNLIFNKVECVKLYRKVYTGTGLVDAKNVVDYFFTIYQINAVTTLELYWKLINLIVAVEHGDLKYDNFQLIKQVRTPLTKENFADLVR